MTTVISALYLLSKIQEPNVLSKEPALSNAFTQIGSMLENAKPVVDVLQEKGTIPSTYSLLVIVWLLAETACNI